tara:strand:+ start:17791 stop:18579 length:789 start_codon:yes stop_codon:yes gene_type:complete
MLCKICKEHHLKLELKLNKRIKNENLFGINIKVYERCLYKCKCGHFYNFHKHSKFLDSIYKKKYSKESHNNLENKFKFIKSLKKKSSNFHRVEFLKKKIDNKCSILDIGSGFGIFPHEMKKSKFNILASETNKEMISFMKKKKIKCFYFNILNKKFNLNKKFDVITFNKVLEHLKLNNIKEVLKKSKLLLKNKGIIYIELPSSTAKKINLYRQEFYFEHYNIFSIRSFRLLIKSIGFKIIYIKDIIEVNKKYTIRAIICPVK